MIADADNTTEADECTCYDIEGTHHIATFCPVHVEEIDTGGLL